MQKYIVQNIKLPIGASTYDVFSSARKRLLKFFSAKNINDLKIYKKSVDARKKNDIKLLENIV